MNGKPRRVTVALALALAIVMCSCRHEQPAPDTPPAAVAGPVPRWQEGQSYVYRVELASRASVTTGPVPVAFDLTGEIALHPRIEGSTVTFLASLREAELRAEGDAVPPQLGHELEEPWGFDMVNGRVESLRVRSRMSPFAVGIASTLAAAFQHPGGPPVDGVWLSEEADGGGHYQARYTAGAEPGSFTKAKLSYRKRSLPTAAGPVGPMEWTPKVLASTGTLRLRGEDIVAVDAQEQLETALTLASRVHSAVTLSLTLAEHGAGAGAADWQSLWSSTEVVSMGDVTRPAPGTGTGPDRSPGALDIKQAASTTFAQALVALEREYVVAPGSSSTAMAGSAPDVATASRQLGAFGTMVAVLRTRPEEVPLAMKAVQRGLAARKGLLDALGSAGGPEAQAALARKMSERGAPEAVRRDAAFALIRTPHPTEASVSALIAGLGDSLVRPYSVLGLGTYSRRLREAGDVALANRAADAVVALLDTVTSPSARVEVLHGIANSGDTRLLGKVRPLLDDRDEPIRAAAVDALRLMQGPEVDAIMALRSAVDEAASVRQAALDAAALREPNEGLVSAVTGAALGAPDPGSRFRAVQILGKWLERRPELRTLLEGVASADSADAVRRAARGALGG